MIVAGHSPGNVLDEVQNIIQYAAGSGLFDLA